MPAVTKDSVFMQTKEQVSCNLNGEAVILGYKKGVYYGLDPVGARIWELLKDPVRVSDIESVILREYEVKPERCAKDVVALIKGLLKADLVEAKHVKKGS